MRNQFHHVIDVAPTVLEAAGLPEPTIVHGVEQKPYEGVSMRYAFDDAAAAERHETQYFEMFCNRGIYHEGWTAVTRHSTPWVQGAAAAVRRRHVGALRHQHRLEPGARPRRARCPTSSTSSRRCSCEEARKYNVLPLDDRRVERFNSDLAGRPTLIKGNSQLLFGGMGRLTENVVINVKNKSHAVTAEVTIPDGGADGVIIAQGGAFAGWSLYLKDGRPKYAYNLFGIQHFHVDSDTQVPPGTHQVRMEFTYDGGGLGKGGDVALYLDGDQDRRGPRRGDRPDGLLGRRDVRHRLRHRVTGQRRLHARGQPLHRHRRMGADRHRRRRRGPRPPDLPRGTPQDRHGAPVALA